MKLLETLNLLQMSVLCDILYPEDIIMCDIDRIGALTTSVYIRPGMRNCRDDGMKVIASLGLLSAVTAATLVWSFFHAYITPLPAFFTGIIFSFLDISLFC